MTPAERIGDELAVMPSSGNFPLSEDPTAFLRFLNPVLEEISSASHTA